MTAPKTYSILSPRVRALLVPLFCLGFLACNDDITVGNETDTGTETGDDDGDGDGDGDTGDPVCGDGMVEGDEECDDGNTDDSDACTNECLAATCGDGIIQGGEECDAGADNDDNASCKN